MTYVFEQFIAQCTATFTVVKFNKQFFLVVVHFIEKLYYKFPFFCFLNTFYISYAWWKNFFFLYFVLFMFKDFLFSNDQHFFAVFTVKLFTTRTIFYGKDNRRNNLSPLFYCFRKCRITIVYTTCGEILF